MSVYALNGIEPMALAAMHELAAAHGIVSLRLEMTCERKQHAVVEGWIAFDADNTGPEMAMGHGYTRYEAFDDLLTKIAERER